MQKVREIPISYSIGLGRNSRNASDHLALVMRSSLEMSHVFTKMKRGKKKGLLSKIRTIASTELRSVDAGVSSALCIETYPLLGTYYFLKGTNVIRLTLT